MEEQTENFLGGLIESMLVEAYTASKEDLQTVKGEVSAARRLALEHGMSAEDFERLNALIKSRIGIDHLEDSHPDVFLLLETPEMLSPTTSVDELSKFMRALLIAKIAIAQGKLFVPDEQSYVLGKKLTFIQNQIQRMAGEVPLRKIS